VAASAAATRPIVSDFFKDVILSGEQ
jgi:hypothetical protein